MSSLDHALLDPRHGKVGGVEPIVEEGHLETFSMGFLDMPPIRPRSKGGLDAETLVSVKMGVDAFDRNPSGADLHALDILRAQAFCDLVGVDEFGTPQALVQAGPECGRLAGSVAARNDVHDFLRLPVKPQHQGTLGIIVFHFWYKPATDLLSGSLKVFVVQRQITKEVFIVLGSEPAKIFVEMARDHELDPKRTISRKKKLEASYKGIKEDKSLLKDLSARDEKELKWKKLYLYYQQRGRCMYTGQIINIEDLSNDNLYDIDHIYPRHFVKDDSLENNLVLVKKEKNAHKSDSYPIEGDIRRSMFYFWKGLYESKLITHEKFNRLIRDTEFTVDEQVGFINRQLVETRQGTKAVAGIFSSVFGKGKVIYVKAGNVSAFRKKFDLIKCREINDLHHAHDAFLNIVVGNTYDIKFTRNVRNFVEKSRGKTKGYEYHMDKIFDYTVKNKDTVAWNVTNNESIKTVKSVVGKNTPLVTVMTEEVHGGISDQQIVNAKAIKKVNGEGYLPVKTTDSRLQNTSKYGGYSKLTGAYFFLVEHTQKKKRVRTLEAVPLYLENNLRTKTQLEKYCKEEKGYIDPSVRLTKIKAKSLFKIEGYYQYVTGRSGNQLVVNNAVQLLLSYDDQLYVRDLQKNLNEQTFEDAMADTFRVKNIDLYKELLSKFTKGIYRYRRPLGLGKQLEKGLATFEQLCIMDQFYILNQIIMLVQMKSRGADLRKLGESKQCGVSMLTKKLSDYKDAELINLSITGLYESRINLLTV